MLLLIFFIGPDRTFGASQKLSLSGFGSIMTPPMGVSKKYCIFLNPHRFDTPNNLQVTCQTGYQEIKNKFLADFLNKYEEFMLSRNCQTRDFEQEQKRPP